MKKKHQNMLAKPPAAPSSTNLKLPTAKQAPRGESSCPFPPPSPVTGVCLPPSPFVKGVSFNPGGVPKGKRVSTRMAEMMTWTAAEIEAVMRDPKSEYRDVLAAKALRRAARDEDAASDMALLLDRTEGKVAQDFNLRSTPTLTPEQVAEQVKNAGLLEGGRPDDF